MPSFKRRELLKATTLGLAGALMGSRASATGVNPKAKRLLYLFMSGGPSQLELLDYKPGLTNLRNQPLPPSVLEGRRITTLTNGQDLRVATPLVSFAQHGQSGMWFSNLLPHMAKFADHFCQIKSMHTDAVNHEPANNLLLTGSQLSGRPSIGAWLSYGLGTLNPNLPSFVALQSATNGIKFIQPLSKRMWGSGFLPAKHQGVDLRPGNTPVLYLQDDLGISDVREKGLYDAVREMNLLHQQDVNNPDLLRRNESYEMASVLQDSMANLADESDEPASVYEAYGPQSKVRGTYAANCIRARRLLERNVRCVMLLHRGWDQHHKCASELPRLTNDTDQATAALLFDLQARGLLEDTLVVWGGEFGRSVYSDSPITADEHGRDHNPYAFPLLLAGAGVKPGFIHGETDDFSTNIVSGPVHVHDLQATLLQLMGLDQYQLTFNYERRNFRLTDLGGRVVNEILA